VDNTHKVNYPIAYLLPEIGAMDIGLEVAVALVSSLAGAAAQVPRIVELETERNKLKQDLTLAQTALSASEQQLVQKISQLEDSLFEMDREFEGQTAKMKKQYDNTLREELQTLAGRLKNEFELVKQKMDESYKADLGLQLEVQKNVLRQDFLKEKLDMITDSGEKTRETIAHVLAEQAKISNMNAELEKALERSKKEIETLVENKNKRNGWWPF
jgi:chromosome segregation ATPase